ncbi:MAG: glycine zipper family protein [Verrucomicrobiae bacterium]|nr:glycine zipper family protein [Verrucomicrobiae bacterium]
MFSARECGLITAIVLTCFLPSCATHTGTGALAGAGLGAAAGTATGKDGKKTLGGALIGAAIGATVGAILDAGETDRGRQASTRRPPAPKPQSQPPTSRTTPVPQRSQWPATRKPTVPPPPPPPLRPRRKEPARRVDSSKYPMATRTDDHGIVISPYAPNKKVDVRNFPSGSIVVDPNSNKRFRVP